MTQVAALARQTAADANLGGSQLPPAVRIPRPEEWLADSAFSFISGTTSRRRGKLDSRPAVTPTVTPRWEPVGPDFEQFAQAVAQDNRLLVPLRAPESSLRGKLAQFVSGGIEKRLTESGASSRSANVPNNLSDVLSDQLYRARLLGLGGLGLAFADLSEICDEGVLTPADSQTLRWWLETVQQHPVSLHLAAETEKLRIFQTPVCIGDYRARGLPDKPESGWARRQLPRAKTLPSQTSLPFEQGLRIELRQPAAALRAANLALAEPPTQPTRRPASSGDEPAHVRGWRQALSDAGGSQTWATLETQFAANYLPLVQARMSNQADARADEVLQKWASSFRQGYESAYSQLCRYSQRPQMIFDLPKIAFNLGREFDAAQVRLVLVDGLRFDLGQRVHDKLRLQLTGLGRCVQRGLTWSSLPCSTAAQLELLARGADGLRSPLGKADIPELVARGAGARKLRPLRTGPHQLYKLDALQPLIAKGQAWGPAELEGAAAEVAVSVGRFLRQQPENTLTVVFGDHGFDLRDGTAKDASPENVLVPYDAWLVSDQL